MDFLQTESPLPEQTISPPPNQPFLSSKDKKQGRGGDGFLPKLLDYISALTCLAIFGILGVLTRFYFQKIYGPKIAAEPISAQSILYLDLPSNMVGSFLMGWFGVVFKEDISRVSGNLAIGLTTGFLGSLTTFSGWNQKMLDLIVDGRLLFSLLGFIIGLILAAGSIFLGVQTALGFRWLLTKLNTCSGSPNCCSNWRVGSYKCHLAVVIILLLILGVLWCVSGVLLKEDFSSGSSLAQLSLACIVGPLGVWIRWFLARLNGRGLGRAGHLKWLPFGTLIANVSAACVMAILSTVKKTVNTKTCDTVATGIQFGLLGCLSTVSTLMVELYTMSENKYYGRAFVYALSTIIISFVLGILMYVVPVLVIS